MWTQHYDLPIRLRVSLRPMRAGSELLELQIQGERGEKLANVVFAPIADRKGRRILSVRDQNTFEEQLRKKRLMTLIHLYLVHRYEAESVHYVSPTDDNQYQTTKMKTHGIFREVSSDIGDIIVAEVDPVRTSKLLEKDHKNLWRLIRKDASWTA